MDILAHASSDPDDMLNAASLLIKRAYTEKADRLMDAIKQQRLENQNLDLDITRLQDEVENYRKQLESRNERIQDIQGSNASINRDILALRNQLADLESTRNRLYKFRAAIMDSLREEETISHHQSSLGASTGSGAAPHASTIGRNASRVDQYLADISDQLASTRRSPLRGRSSGSRY